MGSTYTNLLTHVVFSTKSRIPYLRSDRRMDVFAYMGGIVREIGGFTLKIGGEKDHAHLLVRFPPSILLSTALGRVKAGSSLWIHKNRVFDRGFAWQEGYAAFSVSESATGEVLRYIDNQEAHHSRVSFQDELRAFLKENGIAYDERYMWD